MTSVSFILIAFSILELARGSEASTSSFHLPSIIAVSIAFLTKLCLFLYCWTLRTQYSQIRILWEDHRNDMLINGFGLLTSVGGSKLTWWLDPSGAIILSLPRRHPLAPHRLQTIPAPDRHLRPRALTTMDHLHQHDALSTDPRD